MKWNDFQKEVLSYDHGTDRLFSDDRPMRHFFRSCRKSSYRTVHALEADPEAHEEEELIIQFFESKGRNKDLVIYNCTSGYPVPFEDICLLELTRLCELYASRVKAVGFSGHHLGIAVDSAAVALGAEWIERHFTLDRTWKGTDHAASLEPDGVRKLARDCRAVAKALTYKEKEILDIEEVQRNKLKKNQIKW